jgi:hypothetical protein
MRRIECFQKKYNCINYCPSFFILFISISSLLFVYTPNAINILHQTMYLNNWNNLQIKNMGSLYAIPDCVLCV